MSDRHPLGHTSGPRGVNQVRDVIGAPAPATRCPDSSSMPGSADIDDQHAHSPSSRSANPAVVTAATGAASASMNSIRASRMRRIDRHIRRPGLQHRQNRHDRLGRPRKQQRHTLTRARPLTDQQMRQPIRRLIELAIRPRPAPDTSSPPPPGHAPPARRTTPESTPAARRGLGQHRPITPPIQPGVLTGIQHIHRRQPPRRISGHRHQHPLQPPRQIGDVEIRKRLPSAHRAEEKLVTDAREDQPEAAHQAGVGQCRRCRGTSRSPA